jgi:hypothetical protein
MHPHPTRSSAQTWFRRSMALTLALGAVVVLLVAVRPGFAAFWVASTLAFLVAGFLWSPGGPPETGLRARVPPPAAARPVGFVLARTYRISSIR